MASDARLIPEEFYDGSIDESVFRALTDGWRRLVVYRLLDRDGATVHGLAEHVVSRLQATDDALDLNEERVCTALEHAHLPALSEAGLVSVDREEGHVALERLDEPVASLIGGVRKLDPLDAA